MFTLANQPQGLGRNLDNGFRLFFSGLKGAIGIMFIMIGAVIVFSIIAGLVMGAVMAPFMQGASTGDFSGLSAGSAIIGLVTLLLFALVFLYFVNALILKYANIGYGNDAGIGNALSGAYSRLFPALGASILLFIFLALLYTPATYFQFASMGKLINGEMGLMTFQGIYWALLIPYFFFAITTQFTLYRVVVDNAGPLSAIIGSHKLVWGNWWRTAFYMLIVYIILFAVLLAVMIPTFGTTAFLGQAGSEGPAGSAAMIGTLLLFIFIMLSIPFFVAMLIPFYHDLKLRKEGGDLEAKMATA